MSNNNVMHMTLIEKAIGLPIHWKETPHGYIAGEWGSIELDLYPNQPDYRLRVSYAGTKIELTIHKEDSFYVLTHALKPLADQAIADLKENNE